MKLRVSQLGLAKLLGTVGHAVPAKSPVVILSNVLVEATITAPGMIPNGQLRIVANNLEMAISAEMRAEVEEPGIVTLPAKLLNEFVGALGGGEVQLALKPGTRIVNVKCARNEANINGIDAADFPTVPSVSAEIGCSLTARALRAGVSQVVFAAAADETRPALSGVLLRTEGDELTMAAADGYRLSVRTVPLIAAGERFSLLVPARALTELARILPDSDEQVSLAATPSQNQIVFRAPGVTLTSRLIEGQFPDYQRIIPSSYQTRTIVPVGDLLQAVKTASVFSRENSNIVRIQVTPSGEELAHGRIDVLASAAELGDNTGALDAAVEGEAASVALNGAYLADALRAIDGGEVMLDYAGKGQAYMVRPVGGVGQQMQMIMPMTI